MENISHEITHERVCVDLTDYFRILWKRAGFILLTALLFASAAFVISKKNETVRYKVTTSILIQRMAETDNCARIVKSDHVLKKAAEKLSADFDVDVEDLKKNVTASVVEDTGVIEITAYAAGSGEATETARAVCGAAVDRIDELADRAIYRLSGMTDIKTLIKLGDLKDIGSAEIIEGPGEAELISNINIRKNVIISAILGFILYAGFLGIKFLLIEFSRPIKRPDDIMRYLGEEVLAAVPERKDRKEKMIKTDCGEKSLSLPVGETDAADKEAFRFLRVNITAVCGTGKVFCFTGTSEKDGAASAAFYTAKAFADTGKKVLYIDADTCRPAPGGKNDFPGLCELICGEAAYDDIILKTEYDGLYIMTAGDTLKASDEMFDKAYFKVLLTQCRKNCDYVILNTPPAGSCVDPFIIGKECDGTVFVIKAYAVSSALAMTLQEQMKKMGCRILGTVLTGADMKNDSYYGKYYYSYQEKGLGWIKARQREIS